MAKKSATPKPSDPLAHVQVRMREGKSRMPALSAAPKPVPAFGHNSDRARAIETLNSGIARLNRLDEEIRSLNRAKADVFGELRSQGYEVKLVRRTIKELKLDPLVREDNERLFGLYWEAASSHATAEDEEQAA